MDFVRKLFTFTALFCMYSANVLAFGTNTWNDNQGPSGDSPWFAAIVGIGISYMFFKAVPGRTLAVLSIFGLVGVYNTGNWVFWVIFLGCGYGAIDIYRSYCANRDKNTRHK